MTNSHADTALAAPSARAEELQGRMLVEVWKGYRHFPHWDQPARVVQTVLRHTAWRTSGRRTRTPSRTGAQEGSAWRARSASWSPAQVWDQPWLNVVVHPPSTVTIEPVMNELSSLVRKTATRATSSACACPARCNPRRAAW